MQTDAPFSTRPTTLAVGAQVRVVGFNGQRYENGQRRLSSVEGRIVAVRPNSLHALSLKHGGMLDQHCFDYQVESALGLAWVEASSIRRGTEVLVSGQWLDANSPAAKVAWLRHCLATGRRAGTAKPLTTDNQRRQLEAALAQAEAQLAAAQAEAQSLN